eukprot:jgi/Bigna1/72718/fgenesh1_pg.21_\
MARTRIFRRCVILLTLLALAGLDHLRRCFVPLHGAPESRPSPTLVEEVHGRVVRRGSMRSSFGHFARRRRGAVWLQNLRRLRGGADGPEQIISGFNNGFADYDRSAEPQGQEDDGSRPKFDEGGERGEGAEGGPSNADYCEEGDRDGEAGGGGTTCTQMDLDYDDESRVSCCLFSLPGGGGGGGSSRGGPKEREADEVAATTAAGSVNPNFAATEGGGGGGGGAGEFQSLPPPRQSGFGYYGGGGGSVPPAPLSAYDQMFPLHAAIHRYDNARVESILQECARRRPSSSGATASSAALSSSAAAAGGGSSSSSSFSSTTWNARLVKKDLEGLVPAAVAVLAGNIPALSMLAACDDSSSGGMINVSSDGKNQKGAGDASRGPEQSDPTAVLDADNKSQGGGAGAEGTLCRRHGEAVSGVRREGGRNPPRHGRPASVRVRGGLVRDCRTRRRGTSGWESR